MLIYPAVRYMFKSLNHFIFVLYLCGLLVFASGFKTSIVVFKMFFIIFLFLRIIYKYKRNMVILTPLRSVLASHPHNFMFSFYNPLKPVSAAHMTFPTPQKGDFSLNSNLLP